MTYFDPDDPWRWGGPHPWWKRPAPDEAFRARARNIALLIVCAALCASVFLNAMTLTILWVR
jgi:hypothetical protein